MTRTVLIIGASRGLGLGLARQFSSEGWEVIATVRDPARAEALRRCGLGGVVVAGVVWVVKQPCDGRFDVAVQPEGLAGLCVRKAHVLERLEWCRTLIDAGAMLEEPMSAGLQVAPGGVPRLLHLRVGEPETR